MKIQNPDKVWFTSDLHFGHRMMVAHRNMASMPIEEYFRLRDEGATSRELVTEDELTAMNAAIVDMINSTVPAGDTLFILGDAAWHAKAPAVQDFFADIACNDMHLLVGNHDIRNSYIASGVFSSVRSYREVSHKVDGKRTRMFLFHFPILSWEDCHKGSIHLHGHSHGGGDNGNLKRFDVGIDAHEAHIALGLPIPGPDDCRMVRPLSFAELTAAAETRTGFVEYDHHTPGNA